VGGKMIRFIDLGDQICEGSKDFDFYNTINDQFVRFNGVQTWETTEEFIEDYNGDELDRYLSLIPKSYQTLPYIKFSKIYDPEHFPESDWEKMKKIEVDILCGKGCSEFIKFIEREKKKIIEGFDKGMELNDEDKKQFE